MFCSFDAFFHFSPSIYGKLLSETIVLLDKNQRPFPPILCRRCNVHSQSGLMLLPTSRRARLSHTVDFVRVILCLWWKRFSDGISRSLVTANGYALL
ncbi:hypothetical protein Bca4012_024854 [Brassica carinata]